MPQSSQIKRPQSRVTREMGPSHLSVTETLIFLGPFTEHRSCAFWTVWKLSILGEEEDMPYASISSSAIPLLIDGLPQ